MNTRARRTVAVVVVAALLAGLVAYVATSQRVDPRRRWAVAADAKCSIYNQGFSAIGPPADLEDREAVAAWSTKMVKLNRTLTDDLEGLDRSGAAEVADPVIAAVRDRVAVYEELAASDAPPATLDQSDPVNSRIDEGLAAITAAIEPWGGHTCASLNVGEVVDPENDPMMQWLAKMDSACLAATEDFADLDNRAGAGEMDPASYGEEVASRVRELHRSLTDIGAPPDGAPTGYEALLTAMSDTAPLIGAAVSGNRDDFESARSRWVSAATELRLPNCEKTVTSGVDTPSNLLVAADSIAPTGNGVSGDAITDSTAALRAFIDSAVPAAGVDASDRFGLTRLVPTLVASGVTDVDGDEVATSSSLSISSARTRDGAAPSDANRWLVGVAALDTGGVCTYGVLFGYPRITGSSWAPGTGTCSGDAALAALEPLTVEGLHGN